MIVPPGNRISGHAQVWLRSPWSGNNWADAAATRPARPSMNTSGCEKCKPATFPPRSLDNLSTGRQQCGQMGRGDDSMAFENPTSTGIIGLVQVREGWLLRGAGRSPGAWPSAEAAATA